MDAKTKTFLKAVFALVVPMALQNLINVGITSADVIMLGRVGEIALSGSSLGGQVQFIMTLFLFGLTSGAAILTAQYWGKGDTDTIERVLGFTMRIAVLVGILFTIVAQLFAEQILRLFTTEEPVIREGATYLRVVSIGYVFTCASSTYLYVMRSVERVVISTVVYLVSLVINIILNAIFIFGLFGLPAMGVAGAALATVTARVSELVIVFFYAKYRNRTVLFRFRYLFARNKVLMRDYWKYSLPVILNEVIWGASMSVNAAIMGHLGSSVVAANSVASVVRQLATVMAFGVAGATGIMLGKAIGEGREDIAEDYASRFVKLTLLCGIAGSGIILIARPIVLAVMNLTPLAQGYLSSMMLILAGFVTVDVFTTTLIIGVFRAGGDTRIGLIMDIIAMWGWSLTTAWLAAFVFQWDVLVVYTLLQSGELIKTAVCIWRYRKKIWLRNITRGQDELSAGT